MNFYFLPKKYYNDYVGFNNRMDEIQAAFLLEKLKNLDEINKKKILIANTYEKFLSHKFKKPKIDNFYNVFHIYPIRVKKRVSSNHLRKYLETGKRFKLSEFFQNTSKSILLFFYLFTHKIKFNHFKILIQKQNKIN